MALVDTTGPVPVSEMVVASQVEILGKMKCIYLIPYNTQQGLFRTPMGQNCSSRNLCFRERQCNL